MLLRELILSLCAIYLANGISETIRVNLSAPVDTPRNFVGFLGYPWNDTYPEPAFSTTLKSEMWRSSQYAMQAKYVKNPSRFTKAVTIVFSDTYKYYYSDPAPPNPVTNRTALTLSATKFAQDCLDLRTTWNFPADKFYVDIWNEPDGTFSGWIINNDTDFFNVFKVVHDIVRKTIPNVKIVGPSLAYYYESYMFKFLNYCLKNNITLDAFSWHDMGGTNPGSSGDLDWNHLQYRIQRWSAIIRNNTYKPLQIKELHIQEYFMRGDTNNTYKPLQIKELHIQEYFMRGDTNNSKYQPFVAGMHLGAMTQLEKTGDLVNYVGKSCWKEGFGSTLGCGSASSPNIGASFDIKSKLPLPMWWFWKLYADGRTYRVESKTSSININAISSYRIPGKIDSNETNWGILPSRMNRTIFTALVSKYNASFYTQVMMSAWKTNQTNYPDSSTNITIYNEKYLAGDVVYVQTNHFPGVWGDSNIVAGTTTLDYYGTSSYVVSSSGTIKLPKVDIDAGDNGMYLFTLVNECGDCVNGKCESLTKRQCVCDNGWEGRYCDSRSASVTSTTKSGASTSTTGKSTSTTGKSTSTGSAASTTNNGASTSDEYGSTSTTGDDLSTGSVSSTTTGTTTGKGITSDTPAVSTGGPDNTVSSSNLLIWSSALAILSLLL